MTLDFLESISKAVRRLVCILLEEAANIIYLDCCILDAMEARTALSYTCLRDG
jgi:hypothetical protein